MVNIAANEVDEFLRVFFAPPNQVSWQQIESSPAHAWVRRWVDRLREQPRRATVLPFIHEDHRGKLWHLNYGIAFSETEFRQLGSDLEAFVGPTFSNFRLHRARLSPDRTMQQAVLQLSSGFAYRFFSPADPAGAENFRNALEFMDQVTSREQPRRRELQQSTGRMLRDFYTSLETGQRDIAQGRINDLRELNRLDALNLKFLQIQLLSRLGTAKELLMLSGLPDVLGARRPLLVTQVLVQAVYASFIEEFEKQGDAAGALQVFRDKVLPTFGTLYATQAGLSAPEVAKSGMLLAVASDPPRKELSRRILSQGVSDPVGQQWLQKLYALSEVPPTSVEKVADLLQAAESALAVEDYDGAFMLLRDCPISLGVAQKLISVAIELQTLEAYEIARRAYSQLSSREKEVLQSSRARRIILQEVLQAGLPVTEVTERLPQNWFDWAILLQRHADRKGWYKVGQRGSMEWAGFETLEDPEKLLGLTSMLLELQRNSEVHMAVPHLVFSLRSRERQVSPELTALFSALMTILAINKDCSVIDLRLWADLADTVLEAGPAPNDYRDLIEQATLLWQMYNAPEAIDWALDVLDTLSIHPCRDSKARSDFISAIVASFGSFPQRLSSEQLHFFQQLCSECGELSAANAFAGRPGEPVERSSIYSQLRNRTLAVYSLTEHASRRFKGLVESWFPGSQGCAEPR